jgi:hypothetical protein
LYPLHPAGSRVIFRVDEDQLSFIDKFIVGASSLIIVGSFIWVPSLYAWTLYKWQKIRKAHGRKRAIYAALVLSSLAFLSWGGGKRCYQKHIQFGSWIRVRKWKLWSSWLKFIAMEVIADVSRKPTTTTAAAATTLSGDNQQQSILAFCPHGIFPFAFAFGALPEIAQKAFGIFRPVVATATNYFPIVNVFLRWLGKMYVCSNMLGIDYFGLHSATLFAPIY